MMVGYNQIGYDIFEDSLHTSFCDEESINKVIIALRKSKCRIDYKEITSNWAVCGDKQYYQLRSNCKDNAYWYLCNYNKNPKNLNEICWTERDAAIDMIETIVAVESCQNFIDLLKIGK